MIKSISIFIVAVLSLYSCVSSKKFKSAETSIAALQQQNKALTAKLNDCNTQKQEMGMTADSLQSIIAFQKNSIQALNNQVDALKMAHTNALNELKGLQNLSKEQADRIKQSLENLENKDSYIQNLQKQINYKDSLNQAIVNKLKNALGNFKDDEVNIKIDKGVLYIDISDKLLFESGKYDVSDSAKRILSKVGGVLKNQSDIDFMVEGHTDSVPYRASNGVLLDNWDLSVKRATSVIRLLQNTYGLDPTKMAAGGKGEYLPIASNATPEGRARNRRTRIVILPKLDEFYNLIDKTKQTKP